MTASFPTAVDGGALAAAGAAEPFGWNDLVDELDRWGAGGVTATFWWRDDDAVEATPELETLLQSAGDVPIALAVVPGRASPDLARRIARLPSVTVLQHGWRHESHLEGGVDEYPEHRSSDEVAWELATGLARLSDFFGSQSVPVFAPPWHGFAARFLPLLPQSGVRAISRKGDRATSYAAPGLFQANAHVAPIRWTEPASFEDDETYVTQFVAHLRRRRSGESDSDEPTGLLTHHLDQNARSFDFISRLAELVSAHPAAAWLDARTVFGPALPTGLVEGTTDDQ